MTTNAESLFPPKAAAKPKIYAYSDTHPQFAGMLKARVAFSIRRRSSTAS